MYKGARYLGRKPIKFDGRIINQNDIIKEMPEQEAKDRMGFEPVYNEKKIIVKTTSKKKRGVKNE